MDQHCLITCRHGKRTSKGLVNISLYIINEKLRITTENSDADVEELERGGEVRHHKPKRGEKAGTHAGC